MTFAKLKNTKANSAALKAKIQEGGNKQKDPRIWKHKYDKDTGIGTSLIRFLPRYDADGGVLVPWVEWTEFSFENSGNKYWNRNLRSINKPDPVSELNNAHWDKIPDSARKNGAEAAMARKRKVNKRYIANIVVLNDPKSPENNGKNLLYQFGPAVYNKIEAVWFPKYEDQAPIEFFDWDQGADFRIRTKMGDYGITYDDSLFEQVSALAGGRQEVQEKIYNSMFDLAEFESEDNYKSYDELKSEMIKVLGGRYIAKIMGTEFKPEESAAAGDNPFEQQSNAINTETTQVSASTINEQPNEQPNEQSSSEDPFAAVVSEEQKVQDTSEPDIITSSEQAQDNPFPEQQTPDEDDPFSSLSLT